MSLYSSYLNFLKGVIFIKSRKQKQKEYDNKYNNIPINYNERLEWMVNNYNLSTEKMDQILDYRYNIINNLFIYECKVVQLLEEPEGASRPRFRIINKSNFNMEAINNQFIHVYTPNAGSDYTYMKELTNDELIAINGLINTPCFVDYDAYIKTPSNYNINEVFMSEIGLIRPNITKPDWDNIGKKYCDMYNHNIWLDDSMVIDGRVKKFYSILPRIEITLKYLNCVYNKKQYNSVINRKDYDNTNLYYLNNQGRFN